MAKLFGYDITTVAKLQLNVVFVIVYIALFVVLALICFLVRRRKRWLEFEGRKVLLITAHPDDECMFFGPVIFDARKAASSFSLLCLTRGNYYNQGEKRKQELLKSCKILEINNITTLDNRLLLDSPGAKWNIDLVSDVLLKHMRTHNINAIITFDSYGISGHNNHISIYKAIKRLVDQRSLPHTTSVYILDSVMLLRKYIFIFDLLWAFLTRKLIFVSGLETLWRSQKAMAAHESQYVWYRKLYIVFSRYMVINTLTKIWGDKTDAKH